MTFPVGHKVAADEYNNAIAIATALGDLGFVDTKSDTTSNVGATGTELVASYIQVSTVVGVRYIVYYSGGFESSVAGDIAKMKLRLAATTSDVTGTILRQFKGGCALASKGAPFALIGQFVAAATGTQTIVSTIQRESGTGTLRENGNTTDMELFWLVLSING